MISVDQRISLFYRLQGLLHDDDKEIAKKRVQQSTRMPEEQIREFAVYGTPEDVSRQIDLLEEVGIQYLIVHLEPSRELDALDTFVNNIIKKR